MVAIVGVTCAIQNDRHGRLLTYAMRQIDHRHLEKIDREDLFEGAMEGMTRRLQEDYNDDYTAYISPEEARSFNEELDQEFGGLGIHVSVPEETGQLTVLCPLVDSPAHAAGILPGDVILAIDGRATEGMTAEESVELIHGEVGTPVTLKILHPGEKDPVDVTIVRAVIKVPTVLGDRRNADGSWEYFLEGQDRIGYLRINTISESTAEELREALDWLVSRGMKGLILDLRFNSGGYLDASVDICSLFVDSGTIVSTRGRDGSLRQRLEARPCKKFDGFPIAVLVNRFSASAAEIIAACLQDHHRAVIVGQRSYGKGTVQELLPLDADKGMRRGLLKVTASSYWRPSERNINRGKDAKDADEWGVRPDEGHEVIVKDEDLKRLLLSRRRRELPPTAQVNGGDRPEHKTPQERPSNNAEKPTENDQAKPAESDAPTTPPDDDETSLFDPQLDAAIEYLQGVIHGEEKDRASES